MLPGGTRRSEVATAVPESEGRRCSWPPAGSGLLGLVGDQEAILNCKCQCQSHVQKTYSSLYLLSAPMSQAKDSDGLARMPGSVGEQKGCLHISEWDMLSSVFSSNVAFCLRCVVFASGLRRQYS